MNNSLIKNPVVVALLALFCCALWGSAFPSVKMGYEWFQVQGAASQIYFAGFRFTIAGIAVLIVGSLMEKQLLVPKKSDLSAIAILGFVQTTIQYIFFYLGMANTAGGKGAIINAANVFVSIITAHFIVKGERLNGAKAIGCLLGFAGVVLVNFTKGGFVGNMHFNGEGFILICATAYGISSVMVKFITKGRNPIMLTAYQLTFGGLILILFGFLLGGELSPVGPKAYILFAYLVVISSVAFTIWTILLKHNSVGQVAIFGFSNPLFGVILSGIFLHEDFLNVKNLAALVLVCAGIYIVNRQPGGKEQT